MTLDQLYQKINYFAGKDKRGRTFKVSEFNALLPTVEDSLFSKELDKLVVGDLQDIPQSRLSITPLRPFVRFTTLQVLQQVALLPTEYRRYISIQIGGRPASVVTQREFRSRSTTPLRRPTVRPYCYIDNISIKVSDTTATTLALDYFTNPAVSCYDYCQDENTLNEIYMPAGSRIVVLDDGTKALVSSTGVSLAAPVTKDGISTYPYNSKTVELQWESIYHDQIVMEMLAMVGINLQALELTQYAMGNDKT